MVCPEKVNQVRTIEYDITQHFIQLHGVLQNLEEQLKKKLQDHLNSCQDNIEAFKAALTKSEENITAAAVVSTHSKKVFFLYDGVLLYDCDGLCVLGGSEC